MEFKVEDEVLLKARIIAIGNGNINRYKVEVGIKEFYVNENYIIPARDMTAEEAWEIVKRLFLNKCDGIENAFSDKELEEIFETRDLAEIVNNNTPKQIKTKIEAWEAVKNIKVGDVVNITNYDPITNGNIDHTGVITSVFKDNYYDLILGDGSAWSYVDGEKLKKTGRHIDITGLLEQIGGNE